MAVLFDSTFTMQTVSKRSTYDEKFQAWGDAIHAMNRAIATDSQMHWLKAAIEWDVMADLHRDCRDERIYRGIADNCRRNAEMRRLARLIDTARREHA
jgi:hypothetical protein